MTRRLLVALFVVLVPAVAAAQNNGMSVQLNGPTYRSPNESVYIGYEANAWNFGCGSEVTNVQFYSDSTGLYIYDDWYGYQYEYVWDYVDDDGAIGLGYSPITYYADASGFDCSYENTDAHTSFGGN